jgi:hypothetical protein
MILKPVSYIFAANTLLIIHFAFVCFVVLGGLLVLKWRWLAFIHIPSAIWGALIEFQGWICPLTPLEQRLRVAGNQSGYSGGFIEHYLVSLLYPDYLDRQVQIILGSLVVITNVAIYAWLWTKRTRQQ